jgi:glutathione S-transferase
MLELFNYPQSTCSQKVRLVLAEKQLQWTSRHLAIDKGEQLEDWYLEINPNGVVPTLVHDGAPVHDSSVINEYLEDVFPERPVRPTDPLECAHMRAWRQYSDEVATPAIRYPTFNAVIAKNYADMSEEKFNELAARRPIRKHFYLRMGRKGFSRTDVEAALEQLRSTLVRMERALEKVPWLIGQRFTIADISLVPTVVRLEDLGLERLWSDLPRVADWYRRVQDRPSFATAFFPGARDVFAYDQTV